MELTQYQRKLMFEIGRALVTLYFVYLGLDCFVNHNIQAKALDTKLHNTEAYFINNYPKYGFNFRKYLILQNVYGFDPQDDGSYIYPTLLSLLLIILYGSANLFISILSYFFDDKDKYARYLQYLILL